MLEIELKILEIDPKVIEEKLLRLGAKKEGTVLVIDKHFDFPNHYIHKRKQLLRLRELGDKFFLTHKEKVPKNTIVKILEETETEIKDAKTVEIILKKLGLHIVKYREKKRTSFILNKVRCEIDQYPKIPPYLEIEGSQEDILSVVKELGFSLKDTTNKSASKVLKKYNVNSKILKF